MMAGFVQRPVRSMLHPYAGMETLDTEPLPLYSPRLREPDAEAASIVSEAPTYRSELDPTHVPAATSSAVACGHPATGLPDRPFAPGFGPRTSVSKVSLHSYNLADWSIARSAPTYRHYENVARRRLQREACVTEIMKTLAAVPPSVLEPISPWISEAAAAMDTWPAQPRRPVRAVSAISTYSPSEDPALVGDAAAAQATSQRLAREKSTVEPKEAFNEDGASWTFMTVEMKDWGRRQKHTASPKKETRKSRTGRLAKHIGLGKREG